MAEVDSILQAAINRGSAVPIGTPQTGHIANCDEQAMAENYLQPGGYGAFTTDNDESSED